MLFLPMPGLSRADKKQQWRLLHLLQRKPWSPRIFIPSRKLFFFNGSQVDELEDRRSVSANHHTISIPSETSEPRDSFMSAHVELVREGSQRKPSRLLTKLVERWLKRTPWKIRLMSRSPITFNDALGHLMQYWSLLKSIGILNIHFESSPILWIALYQAICLTRLLYKVSFKRFETKRSKYIWPPLDGVLASPA